MVGSDIGDINSPTHAGSRPTRVDPKLFGKPSDFSGDRREWRPFEWVFRNWFGFLCDTAEECLERRTKRCTRVWPWCARTRLWMW